MEDRRPILKPHDFYIYTPDVWDYEATSCQDMQPSPRESTNNNRLHIILYVP